MRFPRFKETDCAAITVCGQIQTRKKDVSAKLAEDQDWTSIYRVGSGSAYVHVMTGSAHGRHLHVDCIDRSKIPKKNRPKIDTKLSELRKIFSPFFGYRIDAGVIATFLSDVKDLSPSSIVRSMTSKAVNEGVGVQLVSGRIIVEGSPISELTWSLSRNQKRISITLRSEMKLKISETYLAEALEELSNSYRTLILKRPDKDA